MRLAMELEALYASDYPFINYGVDIATMAELEKGIRVERLTHYNVDSDCKVGKEKIHEAEEYLSKL